MFTSAGPKCCRRNPFYDVNRIYWIEVASPRERSHRQTNNDPHKLRRLRRPTGPRRVAMRHMRAVPDEILQFDLPAPSLAERDAVRARAEMRGNTPRRRCRTVPRRKKIQGGRRGCGREMRGRHLYGACSAPRTLSHGDSGLRSHWERRERCSPNARRDCETLRAFCVQMATSTFRGPFGFHIQERSPRRPPPLDE